MYRSILVASALSISTNAALADATQSRLMSVNCTLYTVYLDYPDAFDASLGLTLAAIAPSAEATGMPRGSFENDVKTLCRNNLDWTVQDVIAAAFKRYREQLK